MVPVIAVADGRCKGRQVGGAHLHAQPDDRQPVLHTRRDLVANSRLTQRPVWIDAKTSASNEEVRCLEPLFPAARLTEL